MDSRLVITGHGPESRLVVADLESKNKLTATDNGPEIKLTFKRHDNIMVENFRRARNHYNNFKGESKFVHKNFNIGWLWVLIHKEHKNVWFRSIDYIIESSVKIDYVIKFNERYRVDITFNDDKQVRSVYLKRPIKKSITNGFLVTEDGHNISVNNIFMFKETYVGDYSPRYMFNKFKAEYNGSEIVPKLTTRYGGIFSLSADDILRMYGLEITHNYTRDELEKLCN